MMFLVLEIDNYGILKKKSFYNKDDMNKLKLQKLPQRKGLKEIHLFMILCLV